MRHTDGTYPSEDEIDRHVDTAVRSAKGPLEAKAVYTAVSEHIRVPYWMVRGSMFRFLGKGSMTLTSDLKIALNQSM